MVNKTKILLIALISAVLVIAALSVFLVIKNNEIKALEDQNKTLSAYAMAVPEYEYIDEDAEYITIDDSYLGEISLNPLPGVAKNSYDYDFLEYENGRFSYAVDGIKTSATGVDVSHYNESIDWTAVKADGVDFAMIRLGYRGYEEGVIKEDPKALEYIEGATSAGLDVGVYFYTQAINVDEALEEAEWVLDKIKPYELTYPVVLDIEITSAENVRANDISGAMQNDIAEAFCERIKEDGYRPMIYANKRMAYLKLDMSRLSKYDFWIAEWSDKAPPDFAYDFRIWQYSTEGEVDGISTPVDLNICFYHYGLE
ncbi:MAG: glycoside hydrolase family 25 protein [Ruminococcus sp.]|jgi:GH25 family lysozyme M1 (1,4-beta-N-acetylmuramidase)|nr:glycoside hydrolase family 25 protein [Ruminococcus sp.]